jgi:hypothetical protein
MDKGYKLHFLYNLTASPSSRGYTTINDNPDAISFSWEANANGEMCSALGANSKSVCSLVIDSTKCANSATQLANLAKIIYGVAADPTTSTQETLPRLPKPNEIITIMSGTHNCSANRGVEDDDR